MNVLTTIAAENQTKRGWKLELNGEPVENVSGLRLHNDRFGTLEYGATPAGYDSWCFEEVGGGGSVIVPYFVDPSGMIYIGLVTQDRYTMGGKVENLPRGFLKGEETHFQAAQREADEEFRFNLADRFSELFPQTPTNWNSAFAVTLEPDKGVRFFALRVNFDEVKPIEQEGGVYQFRDDVLKPASKTGELIFGSRFMPLLHALASRDMFTRTGVASLLPTVVDFRTVRGVVRPTLTRI